MFEFCSFIVALYFFIALNRLNEISDNHIIVGVVNRKLVFSFGDLQHTNKMTMIITIIPTQVTIKITRISFFS